MTAAASASGASGAPLLSVKCYAPLGASEDQGKFVLLAKGIKELHLVLSPVSLTPYHADIVYQYLQEEGRGKVEAVSSSGCRILTRSWKVKGGGHYHVQPWLHHLRLHGKSTAFGAYHRDLLEPFADGICDRLGLAGYTFEMA